MILDRVSGRLVVVATVAGTIAASIEVALVAHTYRSWALIGSALAAPVGFVLAWIVLGVQVVNPACSYRLLRMLCSLFFVASAFAAVFWIASYPIMYDATMPIHMSPCALGVAAAAYVIWRRYGERKRAATAR
ncbi:MAG TPA: hypothetical protein VGG28_00350 [Kofleriaceae bacterium]